MKQVATTFIVRLSPSGSGGWSAVVERVKTGEKFRVGDLEGIGALIARIVEKKGSEEGRSS